MRNYVYGKLNNILKDFRREIDNTNNLCTLKELDFSVEDRFPDYNNLAIQQFYLLRYLFGYFSEYVVMYRELLRSQFLKDKLKVCSIGCGCGIDLWALQYVCDEHIFGNSMERYNGIDAVKWKYRDEFKGILNVSYSDGNIATKESFKHKDYNIFIFPKSICEFTEKEFQRLKELIINSEFRSKKFVVMGALRKSRFTQDEQRLNEIAEVFTQNQGYEITGGNFRIAKENYMDASHINSVVKDFNFPAYVRRYLKGLPRRCSNYRKNREFCYDNCKKIIGRNPLESMSQLAYKMIFLEKKDLWRPYFW